MARIRGDTAAAVYRAADAFVDRALRRNGGLFVASRRVWAPEVIGHLHERLAAAEAASGAAFDRRWKDHLAGASPAAVQLAGELVTVHVLFASDLSAATKRRLVDMTLALAPGTAGRPPWLDEPFAAGLARTGVAFKARRLSQLRMLLEAVRAWKGSPAVDRRRRLDDPFAFRDWLAGVPHHGGHAQREALLHLVHPDAFEPIVSPRIKRDIVGGLADVLPEGADDVDRALASARHALTPEHGSGFWFVDPPVAARWRRSSETLQARGAAADHPP